MTAMLDAKAIRYIISKLVANDSIWISFFVEGFDVLQLFGGFGFSCSVSAGCSVANEV